MKRNKSYMTPQQAMELVAKVIRQHLPMIPGLRGDDAERFEDRIGPRGDYLGLEWERSFAVGCRLSVNLNYGKHEREETQVVGETRHIFHFSSQVEVNWSGTGRSPAEAMASIALYQQVTQLACLLETMLGRIDIAQVEEKQTGEVR